MKKALMLILLSMPGLVPLALNLSCSANTPTAANNFQNPVQTIVAINPSLTPTFTFTFTPTNTFTPTGTPTATSTPFIAVNPWTGFNNPSGIAVDGSNNVYVADTGNNRVLKYFSNGLLNPNWGLGAKGKVTIANPVWVAANSAGTTVYVVGTSSLGIYNENGNSLAQITSENSQTLSSPQGVAVDKNNNVYLSDAGNQRIVVMNSAGGYSSTISTGVSIFGVAVDGNGNVFGAASSTVIQLTGSSPVTIPGFSSPMGLAVGTSNNPATIVNLNDLYVADTNNHQVEEFQAGNLLQLPLVIFNNGGSLASPKGVAVDSNGNIYVTDSLNNDVLKFAP